MKDTLAGVFSEVSVYGDFSLENYTERHHTPIFVVKK